jgi:hypothetical protein
VLVAACSLKRRFLDSYLAVTATIERERVVALVLALLSLDYYRAPKCK